MFSLGTIDPLLVEDFDGFDYPQSATRTPLLSDGTSTRNELIQSSGLLLLTAHLTGTLAAEDIATLRGYYATMDPVTFTDANGNARDVRVFECAVSDFTDWGTFAITLVESDVAVGS